MIRSVGKGGQVTLVVKSEPPTGSYKVLNVYVDPETGRAVVEYDDTPA